MGYLRYLNRFPPAVRPVPREKRVVLSLFGSLAAFLLLAACSGSPSASPSPTASSPLATASLAAPAASSAAPSTSRGASPTSAPPTVSAPPGSIEPSLAPASAAPSRPVATPQPPPASVSPAPSAAPPVRSRAPVSSPPKPVSSPPSNPATPAPATVTVTNADLGKTLQVKVGATVVVALAAAPGMQPWVIQPPNSAVLATAAPVGGSPAYRAARAGTAEIRATDRPVCNPGQACAQLVQAFKATVIVSA
jgi:hypothetical protein